MITAAVTVDWGKLIDTALVSAAFGIGVILVGGLAVVASLRAQDRQREDEGGVIALNVLTGACVVAILGAVALGIWVMVSK